jgi:hypothetical protein
MIPNDDGNIIIKVILKWHESNNQSDIKVLIAIINIKVIRKWYQRNKYKFDVVLMLK